MNEKVKTSQTPGFWMVWLIIALIVFQTALFGLWYFRSVSGRKVAADNQRQTLCVLHLEGHALGYAFDALAAPPVPPNISDEDFAKTERGIAVAKGLEQVTKLKDPSSCR